jgi:peptidyl-dipeptidase Dcp
MYFMKRIFALLIISVLFMQFKDPVPTGEADNPLLGKYSTPFGVPPFHKIRNEHFKPAIEKGIALQKGEIEAILANSAAPDFPNTIEALENSGYELTKASIVMGNLNSANTNDTLQKIVKEMSPVLSKHRDEIYMNPKLFARVKAVYEMREKLGLTGEKMRLLENMYTDFVRGGAALDENGKKRLAEINRDMGLAQLQFEKNVLDENNAFKLIVDNKGQLAGLPEEMIATAAKKAEKNGHTGKWLFTVDKPTLLPFLQYCENRSLREKMYKGYIMRGDNNNASDNKELIKKIVLLRDEKAKLLGYTNFASFRLDENMAKNPENVYKLLDKLWVPALKRAKAEEADMQVMIDKQGLGFKLEGWDWWYFAEKVRCEKYALDDEALRPYFKLENVRDGVFYVAGKLYGLTFSEIKNIPTYHPDAKAFEVKNSEGKHQGVLYMDFHPRASKKGGAWCTSYRKQMRPRGENTTPVVSIVCNFTSPTADKPALLSMEEVETLFHEFGHGLHNLLSNCTYRSLSGSAVPRDFVELPSQIMEHWATQPEVLKVYAKHYQTGKIISQELIDKLQKSKYFNQGFVTVEYLAAALLDMDFHTSANPKIDDVAAFEKQAMDKRGLISSIVPRYRSTHFGHTFSGGYAAGYYAYIWAEILDADAFEAFLEKGIFDKNTAKLFRTNVLEKGNTRDPMTGYKAFRGAEPKEAALLKNRGLM